MRGRISQRCRARELPRPRTGVRDFAASVAVVVVVVVVVVAERAAYRGRPVAVSAARIETTTNLYARGAAEWCKPRDGGAAAGAAVRGMNIILGSYSHFRTLYALVCVSFSDIHTHTHTLTSPLHTHTHVYTIYTFTRYGQRVCVRESTGIPPRPPDSTSGRRQRVALPQTHHHRVYTTYT